MRQKHISLIFFLFNLSLVLYRCKSLCCLLFDCTLFLFTYFKKTNKHTNKQPTLNFYIHIYPLYSIFFITNLSLVSFLSRVMIMTAGLLFPKRRKRKISFRLLFFFLMIHRLQIYIICVLYYRH